LYTQIGKEREQQGMTGFGLQRLLKMGFHSFKVLRPSAGMMAAILAIHEGARLR